MKKFTKVLLKIMPVVLVAVILIGSVYGTISTTPPTGGTGIGTVDTAAKNMWKTVQTIVQILAFAAILIAGLRYMFAGADAKSDIKKQTLFIVIGAIFVFLAGPLVDFIVSIASGIGIKK